MESGGPLGTLAGLWRYPVKSLAPEALTRASVATDGLAGDRGAALFVTSPDRPRSGKTLRGKEQPRFHTLADAESARRLAEAAAFEVDVRDAGPYFDAMPVSLIFDRWLDELEALVGFAPEPLRFRPNLFVRAATNVPPETEFVGRRLRIGEVELDVVTPIVRCVTPSYDLVTAESSADFLRTLVNERGNLMGIYCTVARAGTLGIGDELREIAPAAAE